MNAEDSRQQLTKAESEYGRKGRKRLSTSRLAGQLRRRESGGGTAEHGRDARPGELAAIESRLTAEVM